MASIADLARQRINILDYRLCPDATHDLVFIEYQYQPADNSPRTWHKTVIWVEHGAELTAAVLDAVNSIKRELEA